MRTITLDNEQLLYLIEQYLVNSKLLTDTEMLSEIGPPKVGRDYVTLVIEDL